MLVTDINTGAEGWMVPHFFYFANCFVLFCFYFVFNKYIMVRFTTWLGIGQNNWKLPYFVMVLFLFCLLICHVLKLLVAKGNRLYTYLCITNGYLFLYCIFKLPWSCFFFITNIYLINISNCLCVFYITN